MTLASIHQACATVLQQLTVRRLSQSAERMSMVWNGDGLEIPFFDRIYRATANKIMTADGHSPTEAVVLAVGRYILQFPAGDIPLGPRVTFRELSGAGPLVASFANNTNKLIAGTFAADIKKLEDRCRRMSCRPEFQSNGFDLSASFAAFPKVPLYLQFNAADDLFPAQATLLFHTSAEHYLDMQTLFILGTYLAGRLVSQRL